MSRAYLGLQTTLVVVLVALVSWPEFRPVRAAAIWRVPAERIRPASMPARTSDAGTDPMGLTGRQPWIPGTSSGFVTPDVVAALGAKVNALVGRAQSSLNVPIPFALVLLRDLRSGAVAARLTADESGRYQFTDVRAGIYIVEVIGGEGAIVAASNVLTVNDGAVLDATVRVAPNSASVAAAFGNALSTSLSDAVNQAAARNVTRTPAMTDVATVTPEQ